MKTLLWLAAALASACLPSITDADPLRVMSAPNLLRVGTVESIFVEWQEYAGTDSMDVRISVLNFPTRNRELANATVTLNQANKYQALGELVIPPASFDKNPTSKQYVHLLAAFPGHTLEKLVLVSFQSGHMFIQTDKTLYTPDSLVNFRIFAVTPGMKPVKRDEATGRTVFITVEMVTPDGIVISLGTFSPQSGIHSGSYRLSDVVSIGQWKVVSRFQSNPHQSYSAEFEVKKYVLPSYEVKLMSESPSYYFNTTSFSVTIKATYLFGKDVDGTAYVVFGFIEDHQKKVFPASLQRISITRGDGVATLKKEHILQTYPDINELVGRFLFVTATVYTESGSEMVEAELRNIQIVKSPYFINFDKTPKYFKEGMPFDVTVTVTHPDGTPAQGVPVVVEPGENLQGTTEANGRATVTINIGPSDVSSGTLNVTARTNDHLFPAERQTSESMVAKPHQSSGGHFIYISMSTTNIKLNIPLKVQLTLSQSGQFDLTYLILSRGQLVHFGKQSVLGPTVVLHFKVTKKMLPSFRLIVYYHPSPTVVVSDSIWVDVDDSCMGTLKLEPKGHSQSYEPKHTFELKITGDKRAKVGLVAVDKGVYVLNKKHLLTQKRVWEVVEKTDTGCTPGGGANSMGVFSDAGLVFETDTAAGTPYRQELKCPSPPSRKRRVTTLPDVKTTLTSTYTDPLQRECCLDGMKSTQLSYTCKQRALYITDGEACEKAFLHCCEELVKQRSELQQNNLILARSEEDDSYMDSGEISSRTQFPESWFWTTIEIPPKTSCSGEPNCEVNSHVMNVALKDSITTWVFTGISLSENNSICVSDPLEVVAYQPFFIDLRLPYAAVVGEQIEIRAILHNYIGQTITVRVELKENKDVCSSAWKRGRYMQEIKVEHATAQAVPFVIIPMKEGLVNIDVTANIKRMWRGDRVIKTLRVVPYGVLTKVTKSVLLDPKARRELTVRNRIPRSAMVPNSPASTKVFITGRENIGPLVENVFDASAMERMIHLPKGCGEQNMYHMTQTVIATIYLDKTNQWEAVGVDKRKEALEHIKAGVQNQMVYAKPDGSFAVFTFEPGSTWLTAYVVKVFSMASDLIEIERSIICNAVQFLISRTQKSDGMFKDIGYIYDYSLTGDLLGRESDASLTAFCLIALQEATICNSTVNGFSAAQDLSVRYLERRLPSLRNPYAVAITSYALAKVKKLNKQILFNFASPNRNYWASPRGHMFSLEATAYALLALVKGNFLEDAKPIVRWFTRQRNVEGGYGSTQATIMVYQAVSEYWALAKEPKYTLDLQLTVPGRSAPRSFQFTQDNYYTTRTSEKFQQFNGDVRVILNGTGEATMTLVTEYYTLPKEDVSDCKKFNLSVNFSLDKVENEGDIYKLRMEFSFKSKFGDASMSILDISVPTGFEALSEDLNELATGRAAVISHWEFNQKLSKKGSVILYLKQVAHDRVEELAFRMRQKIKVGVLQPASVSIYEYYDETKCVKYYHPQRKDGRILRRCRGQECLCAEENCSMQLKGLIDNRRRFDKLCESNETSRIDYVYHVIVEQASYDASFDIYAMRVDEVIKEGSYDKNVQGQRRKFLSFPHCRENLNIQNGTRYLLMGTAEDTLEGDSQTYEYLLGERTWIEHSPTEEQCQTDKHRQTCLGIEAMIFRYERSGCKAK